MMESQYCAYQPIGRQDARDDSPYLVHHHDRKQIADGSEKEAVQIMLHAVANALAEDVQQYLTNHKEKDPGRNVTQRPAVLQCIGHENDLHHHIDEQADSIQDVKHHEKPGRVGGTETGLVLESQDRNSP